MTLPLPEQRWERPEIHRAPPGFWKRQLSAEVLSIAARDALPVLRQLLQEQPETLNQRGPHGRTLLWEAVRAGRAQSVRFLLDAGADPSLTGSYNSESVVQITSYSAARYYRRDGVAAQLEPWREREDIFRRAFLGEATGVVAMLDAQPALLNAEDPHDPIYFTPLIAFAASGRHIELVQQLIARGAQLAQFSAQLLWLAAKAGSLELLEVLLAGGADARAAGPLVFLSPSQAVMARLIDNGAPINAPGANGFPPLVYLARADKGARQAALNLLLARGADVNVRGPQGRTALHYAAAAGNAAAVRTLLAHGADQALEDDGGRTPMKLARAAQKMQIVGILRGAARATSLK
jgi:Ankyrin repeats (3 copies)/Ankyrin repeat